MIAAKVEGFDMKMIVVDGGSSTDIMFFNALEKLGNTKKDLEKIDFPLVEFVGCTTYPLRALIF